MAFVSRQTVLTTCFLPEALVDPAPRDDVESLGYSLLHLACGNLPWMYNVWHGTRRTQYDQVRIKKLRYSGADLAPDGLPFIGEMIDHARSLKFGQLPDYDLLRSKIRETRERAGLLKSCAVEWPIMVKAAPGSFIMIFPCRISFDTVFLCR
jgi:hypothetical protein